MLGLLAIVGVVLLLVWIVTPFVVFRLSVRVRKLEEALQTQSAESTRPAAAAKASAPAVLTQSTAAPMPRAATDTSARLVAWVKEEWLLKVGGLLLLVGFGWLASYAFINNWIGPMGRIALGIVLGTLILILGTWRIKKYMHQGSIFLVVGSTTILLTIFAAREIYGFFTPLTALTVMFLSSAYVALVSVRYRNQALSLASVILAGVAPLLTNSPSADYIALFAYLLIVVLGTVWVVALTGQRAVTGAALFLVALYSIPHPFGQSADAPTLLLFAYAFAAVFFITNTVGILKSKDGNLVPDLVTAAGNGLFLLAWIMTSAPEEWRSLIISAWMLAFVGGAFAAFVLTKKREPFYVYAGVGVAMLAAATAAELSGAALTIAYTIECAVVSFLAYLILRDRKIAERLGLLFVGPMVLSIQSMDPYKWGTTVLHQDFFVLAVLSLALLSLGMFFHSLAAEEKDPPKSLAPFYLIAGSIYAYILLWLSLHAYLQDDDLAVMIALVVYTITGLITHFIGRMYGMKMLGMYGGVLLGCVIARLFLVDVWKMELAGRIITFFLIGILLMSTAFIGRGKKSS